MVRASGPLTFWRNACPPYPRSLKTKLSPATIMWRSRWDPQHAPGLRMVLKARLARPRTLLMAAPGNPVLIQRRNHQTVQIPPVNLKPKSLLLKQINPNHRTPAALLQTLRRNHLNDRGRFLYIQGRD